jgi:predicted transcriptional regulator
MHDMYSSYKEATAMNFNIYLDDETGQQLNHVATQAGENRNALVRRAVSEWLNRHGKPQWPDEVLAFRGLAGMPAFEAGIDSIKPPAADPLA